MLILGLWRVIFSILEYELCILYRLSCYMSHKSLMCHLRYILLNLFIFYNLSKGLITCSIYIFISFICPVLQCCIMYAKEELGNPFEPFSCHEVLIKKQHVVFPLLLHCLLSKSLCEIWMQFIFMAWKKGSKPMQIVIRTWFSIHTFWIKSTISLPQCFGFVKVFRMLLCSF